MRLFAPMAKSSTSGQGRPKGARNKATQELQDLAKQHTVAAVKELARLSKEAKSETARVAAINSLLDRGYGKPAQQVTLAGDKENPLKVMHELGPELAKKLDRLSNA